MQITCPDGHKLELKESQVGKKVRCPKCQQVFVARSEEALDQDARIVTSAKRRKPDADDEDEREDEDGSVDEDDAGTSKSSGAKKKRGARATKRLPLWRKLAGPVILVVLLGVLAVIVWRTTHQPGTVQLEMVFSGSEVFVNGRKISYDPIGAVQDLPISLPAGEYEIKVTKTGFQPFVRQVSLKSGETETIVVDLIPVRGAKR